MKVSFDFAIAALLKNRAYSYEKNWPLLLEEMYF